MSQRSPSTLLSLSLAAVASAGTSPVPDTAAQPQPVQRAADTAQGAVQSICALPLPAALLNSPNAVHAAGGADPVTVVLDFKAPGEPVTTDIFGFDVGTFDVTGYGFDVADFDMVAQSVFCAVVADVLGIPDSDVTMSPLPPGEELDLAIVIGDIGSPPSNGASEYYYIQIGSGDPGFLGAAGLGAVRDSDGNPSGLANASVVGTVLTNRINGLFGLVPSDALTSGDLGFTTNAIAGTTSHELGHTVSLLHLDPNGFVSPTGLLPVMGTGATGLSNQARIFDREFTISGVNAQAGGASQFHIQQMIGALGLRSETITSCTPNECVTFCSSLVNATGAAALIRCSGDPVSSLVLTSSPVPDTTGQFFFGPMALAGTQTLGDGLRCVGGMTTRLLPLIGAGMMQSPDTASLAIDYAAPYASGLTGTQYFQYWFRSGLATGTGSNTSDGLEVTF